MELTITSSEMEYKGNGEIIDTCGNYNVYVYEDTNIQHLWCKKEKGTLHILFGSVFHSNSDPFALVYQQINNGSNPHFIDGSFLYITIDVGGSITVYSEREGLIPIYYRIINQEIQLSTRCDYLFFDFAENGIDYSALYDFLRYGLLVGDHTLHKEVRLIEGGSILSWNKLGGCEKKKVYCFHHDSNHEEHDLKKLYRELNEAYLGALKKRVDRPIGQIAVFLSGGMDSRMVLAGMNRICGIEGKVPCVSFGQYRSEELDTSRKVANVENNSYFEILLSPNDHLKDANNYLRLACGSDMFSQSYIISAAKQIKERGISAFLTGSFIECHIGGTFLPQSAIESKEKFSDYIVSNMGAVKSELFKENDLMDLLVPGAYEQLFEGQTDNLREEAKKYDDFPVKDIIQSFIIDNRDKRLVLNRETTPGLFLDYINPNFDKDFLSIASTIPAQERYQRKFYRDFFVYNYPEYANIVYNNTTLPVSAPLNMWKEGSKNEYSRELLWAEFERTYVNGGMQYYPHYYSDFDGYSRYDSNWISLFEQVLFSEDSVLIGKVFDKQKVKQMYLEHKSGKQNFRKYLISLVSLELFLKLRWE